MALCFTLFGQTQSGPDGYVDRLLQYLIKLSYPEPLT